MAGIKIGLATVDDREAIAKYLEHYGNLALKRAECYTSHNFTVLAKDRVKLVGILQWYVKEDPNDGIIEFEEMHVLEDYRQRGIGSLLVEFAIQSVNDHFKMIQQKPQRIFLFVDKMNAAARKLYEKHGFKFVAELENLFNDNEIETIYILKL
jgi:ribosomal protein S18 acetylase RimI-like enzyme